jgi:hypothetical protein
MVAIFLLYWWLGFELAVLSTLSVMAGHIVKMSWKES